MQRTIALSLILICLTALNSPTADAPKRSQPLSRIQKAVEKMTFRGKPIDPRAFQHMLGNMETPRPFVVAIDLGAAEDAAEFDPTEVKTEKGAVYVRTKEDDSETEFSYRRLGAIKNTAVVETWNWCGGSGVFEDLLFVTFEEAPAMIGESNRQFVMRLVGHYVLGDRDQRKITVLKDRVVIGSSGDRAGKTIYVR